MYDSGLFDLRPAAQVVWCRIWVDFGPWISSLKKDGKEEDGRVYRRVNWGHWGHCEQQQ
jgi:hypothetical protein